MMSTLLTLQVKSEPDVIHMYLVQLLASLLAGRLANIAQSWDSRDPGVTASWCISGAMVRLLHAGAMTWLETRNQKERVPHQLNLT